MARNFLTQVVNIPTRNSNTLDIVLTNTPQYITNVHSNSTTLSDHNIVKIDVGFDFRNVQYGQSIKEPSPYSFYSLNLDDGDYEEMNTHMSDINWEQLFDLCSESDKD